jgi:LysM repeat protein
MARVSRSRTNRTVIFIVVMAITVGAALQFRRLKKANAEVPPLQMSVAPVSTVVTTVVKPAPAVSQPPAFKPLVTQTPDPTKPVSTFVVTKPTPTNVQTAPVATKAPSVTPAPSTPVNSGSLLTDASAKVAAGDLIGARTILNNALVSGSLSAAETDAVKKQMSEINQTLIFSPRQFPKDPLGGVYTVKSGDKMSSIGNAHLIPYELLLPLNRMTDARKLRYGQTLKIINGPFHAIVSKSKFTLDVYLGAPGGPDSTYITTFNVGLGTDNSTPTGTWSIKNKVVHPAYFPPEGHAGPVLAPDDPKNPLGAYWMGLEGTDGQAVGQRSYGIHGTIDPTSIGKQSSMGCIRLKNEDVEVLYKLLMQGKSTVIVNP